MTLTRYILGRYLAAFAITLPVFILLYWLIDLFEIVGDFMKLPGGVPLMFSFYLAKLPMVLYQILPVAGVFASIFTIGSMKRHGELVAAAALGLPLWRIVVPFLLPLLLVGSGTGLLGETLVPWSHQKTQEITIKKLGKFNRVWLFFNRDLIWYRIGAAFYRVIYINERAQSLYRVNRLTIDENGRVLARIDAKQMLWDAKNEIWILKEGVKWTFGATPSVRRITRIKLPERFDQFSRSIGDPQSMTVTRIRRQIRRLEKQGRALPHHRFALHSRFALPSAALLFGLLAVFLVVKTAWPVSLAGLFSGGLFLVLSFWLLFAFGQLFGLVGSTPIWFGAWLPGLTALLALTIMSVALRSRLARSRR